MPERSSEALRQQCPGCGIEVDISQVEPLARVECSACGEKFRVASVFDHFELVETLGIGGMGAVYKARDARLDRFVALKLLRKELSASPAEAARLEQEARLTAAINHPHVVQVYSSGSAHGQLYLVMELIEHGSLDDRMAQQKKVPERAALQAGIQVAKGLEAAYGKGLIHRDVKPANILYSDPQTAKIGDFGLAVVAAQKSDADSELWGTPYYVAPERLNSEPEDFRSDMFSLGATLFHAMAGRPPMEGETTSATALRQLKARPPALRDIAPEISRDTSRIIGRMLAPNPANRFATYRQLIEQLAGALRALPAAEASFNDRDGAAPPRRRAPVLWAAGAVIVLAAIAAGVFFWQSRHKTSLPSGAETTARIPSPTPANESVLRAQFDAALRKLSAGDYGAAATAFSKVSREANGLPDLRNFAGLSHGLALMLERKMPEARQVFQRVEQTAQESGARGGIFEEAARALSSTGPVRGSVTAEADGGGVRNLATLLFAVKNWQLSEFADAATMFQEFERQSAGTELAWIDELKELARKFLAEYSVYTDWRKLPQRTATAAELRSTIDAVKALSGRLKMQTALNEALQDNIRRLGAQLAQREKADAEREEARARDLQVQEAPAWAAALAAARPHIHSYEFDAALKILDAAKLSAPALQKARDAERQRLQWLAEWKSQLIADLNTGRLQTTVQDVAGVTYAGVKAASQGAITLRIPAGAGGTAQLDWTRLAPRTLLTMSLAFREITPPSTADRQWRAAAFAHQFGEAEAAKALADAAIAADPAYREKRPLLLPGPSPAAQ